MQSEDDLIAGRKRREMSTRRQLIRYYMANCELAEPLQTSSCL